MITEYQVINAVYPEFLDKTALALTQGWQPQGGVSIVRENQTTYYFQAFVKSRLQSL